LFREKKSALHSRRREALNSDRFAANARWLQEADA